MNPADVPARIWKIDDGPQCLPVGGRGFLVATGRFQDFSPAGQPGFLPDRYGGEPVEPLQRRSESSGGYFQLERFEMQGVERFAIVLIQNYRDVTGMGNLRGNVSILEASS